MKRTLIILSALLALSLTACGTPAAEPAPAEEPAAAEPAAEPRDFTDIELIRIANDAGSGAVILADLEPVARGEDVSLVTDYVTGDTMGYAVGTPGRDAMTYKVYRPDGSLWYEAGECSVRGTAGRWLVLSDGEDYETATLIFADPATGERHETAFTLLSVLDDTHWLLSDWEYQDTAVPTIVDPELNPVHTFDDYSSAWFYRDSEASRGYITLTDSDYLSVIADPETFEILPYVCTFELEGSYTICERDDGLYDLFSPDGAAIEEGTPVYYRYYSDAIVYGDENDDYFITVNGETEQLPGWCETGTWDGGFYLLCSVPDSTFLRLYSADGTLNNTIEAAPGEDDLNVSAAGNLLLVSQSDSFALYNAAGKLVRTEPKNEDGYVWLNKLDENRYALNRYGSAVNGAWFETYALMDADGNVIKEHFNSLCESEKEGVYQARRGFNYGLIDADGNWLWSESIFTSATDETDILW